MIRRYFLLYLLAALCVGLIYTDDAAAQRVSAYTMSTFNGSYSSIYPSGTFITSGDDGVNSTGIPMPFAFKYDDVQYTTASTFFATTNGRMRVGATCGSSFGNFINNTGTNYQNNILPLTVDLYATGQTGSGVYYTTTGTAPNRVLIVEWYQFTHYAGSRTTFTAMQVKLYETSGMVEFIYKDKGLSFAGSTATMGVGLHGAPVPTYVKVYATATTTTPPNDIRFSPLPDRQISVTPEIVDFGIADGGVPMTATITVTSVGTAPDPVLINNVVISTGHPDFTVLTMPPASLSPGESATFEVQWIPGGAGPRGAVLLVQSNGRDSGNQQVSLMGYTRSGVIETTPDRLFGKKRVALGESIEETIIIKSVGLAPLTINNPNGVVISGGDASLYTVTRMPALAIPSGGTDSIRVRYSPTSEGAHTSTLRINNGSSNNPAVDIQLRGAGILPHITVTPQVMNFDSVDIGTTEHQKFTICNTGSDTLRILRNEFTSADGDFVLTPLVGAEMIIAPEKCREVDVAFTPMQKGTRVARYHLVTNIPLTFEQPRRDTATNSLYFDIRGAGVPIAKLSANLTDDGIVDSSIINQEKCREVVITNDGDADATITGSSFGGTSAADYKVKGITYPYLLKAKSSVTVQVCGTPAARGSRLATMTIAGMSSEKAISYTSTVDIKGLEVCLEATPTLAFETSVIPHTQSDTVEVTVTNCGDVATTYSAALTVNTEGAYTVTPATSGTVEAGGTATFFVYFMPTTSGMKAGTLTITSTNAGTKTVDLQGTGACAILDALATVEAPNTAAGSTQQFTVTVNNTGNLTWDPGTPVITPSDAYTYVSGATPIAAGGSGTLTFSFNPPSFNTFVAQVTFPNAKECGNPLAINLTGAATTGSVKDIRTVDGYVLGQNAPNPTNGSTTFSYTVPTAAAVRIILADVTGKMVRELVNTNVQTGSYEVDVNTTGLASGTFLYIMEAGNARLVRQMVVSK
jgi:hypothetical protein